MHHYSSAPRRRSRLATQLYDLFRDDGGGEKREKVQKERKRLGRCLSLFQPQLLFVVRGGLIGSAKTVPCLKKGDLLLMLLGRSVQQQM